MRHHRWDNRGQFVISAHQTLLTLISSTVARLSFCVRRLQSQNQCLLLFESNWAKSGGCTGKTYGSQARQKANIKGLVFDEAAVLSVECTIRHIWPISATKPNTTFPYCCFLLVLARTMPSSKFLNILWLVQLVTVVMRWWWWQWTALSVCLLQLTAPERAWLAHLARSHRQRWHELTFDQCDTFVLIWGDSNYSRHAFDFIDSTGVFLVCQNGH